MTKKLDLFIKNQNKARRTALLHIKKLLNDKRVSITIDSQIGTNRVFFSPELEPEIIDTGERKITLEWREKLRRH